MKASFESSKLHHAVICLAFVDAHPSAHRVVAGPSIARIASYDTISPSIIDDHVVDCDTDPSTARFTKKKTLNT